MARCAGGWPTALNSRPETIKAVADAVKDQSAVSQALDKVKEDPKLQQAEQKSDAAKDQIAADQTPQAQQNQEQVLSAINDAIKD